MSSQTKNKIHTYSFTWSQWSKHDIENLTCQPWSEKDSKILNKHNSAYATSLDDFIKAEIHDQRKFLDSNGEVIVKAHCECLFLFEQDHKVMTHVLASLDGILYENDKMVKFIYDMKRQPGQQNRDVIQKLSQFIHSKNGNAETFNSVIVSAACRIQAVLVSHRDYYENYKTDAELLIKQLMSKYQVQTKSDAPNEKSVTADYIAVVCLTHLLLVPGMTKVFLDIDGHKNLKDILARHGNSLQLVYYTFLCLWSISFEDISEKYFCSADWNIIPEMINALKSISREKLSKIAFRIFKNISRWQRCVELMNDNDLLKVVENELKKNIKEEGLRINLESINDDLERNYKISSSYEKYLKELDTGKLHWGPCHNEKFWKTNGKRFSENEYGAVKKLIRLLDDNSNSDALTLAVACHDIGEFCRFVSYSKMVLETSFADDMGEGKIATGKFSSKTGKQLLMGMIDNKDKMVKEQALLATQKMMIHNWQSVKG